MHEVVTARRADLLHLRTIDYVISKPSFRSTFILIILLIMNDATGVATISVDDSTVAMLQLRVDEKTLYDVAVPVASAIEMSRMTRDNVKSALSPQFQELCKSTRVGSVDACTLALENQIEDWWTERYGNRGGFFPCEYSGVDLELRLYNERPSPQSSSSNSGYQVLRVPLSLSKDDIYSTLAYRHEILSDDKGHGPLEKLVNDISPQFRDVCGNVNYDFCAANTWTRQDCVQNLQQQFKRSVSFICSTGSSRGLDSNSHPAFSHSARTSLGPGMMRGTREVEDAVWKALGGFTSAWDYDYAYDMKRNHDSTSRETKSILHNTNNKSTSCKAGRTREDSPISQSIANGLPVDISLAAECLRLSTPGLVLEYPADAEEHFQDLQQKLDPWVQKYHHVGSSRSSSSKTLRQMPPYHRDATYAGKVSTSRARISLWIN